MSTAIPLNNCPLDSALYPINPGFSPESDTVKNRLREVNKDDWQSFTKGLCLIDLFDFLEEVYSECSESNWDGYNAKPITLETFLEARSLISSLPISFPLPEVVPEPTGEIAFEWYRKKRYVFVISVGGNKIITYAGLFGKTNKIRGTAYYSESLPPIIIENLQRLFK